MTPSSGPSFSASKPRGTRVSWNSSVSASLPLASAVSSALNLRRLGGDRLTQLREFRRLQHVEAGGHETAFRVDVQVDQALVELAHRSG